MANITYTPPELARVVRPPRRSVSVRYRRDVYWFATTSVTQGTNQPVVSIPANGPGAAGATFPAIQPQIESTTITVYGTLTPEQTYGSNLGRPAGVGATLTGGI